jgi:hypothetical protein
MPTGGQIQNITQLFSTNQVFEVPDFQRNYSWEQKQVDELFSDIQKTNQAQDNHFLGSLIILQAQGSTKNILEVVDGQQRLTTLFLLIAAIRDAAVRLPIQSIPGPDMGFPVNPSFDAHSLLFIPDENGLAASRFIAHPMIAGMVETAIFAYPNADRPKLPKMHLKYSLALRKAYWRLLDQLNAAIANKVDDEERVRYLARLLDTIKYKLKVLNVHSDSNSEAYEIFMTLNSRGMPLGPSDLVKSEIFKHLTKDAIGKELEAKRAVLTADWQQILTNLEDGDIDQFLRHFLLSKYKGSLTSKKIFERIDTLINKGDKDPVDESAGMLEELKRSSVLYKYLLANDYPEIVGEESSLHLLQELTDSYRILCLAIIDPDTALEKLQRVELIRICEVAVVRWVLAGQNAQELEDLMQELSLELRGGASYDIVRGKLKAKIVSDEKTLRVFEDTVDSAAMVKVILHRINKRWDANDLIPYNSSAMHLEHIAPATSTPEWMSVLFPGDTSGADRQPEYETAVELWGNKTLLEQKINVEIKQKPFAEKRVGGSVLLKNGQLKHYKGYEDSPIEITKNLATGFTEWNRKLIDQRAKWIGECFLKIWSVEQDISSIQSFSKWHADQPKN